MRHVIWKHDDFFDMANGRVDANAEDIALPKKPVPILTAFDQTKLPSGRAEDFDSFDGGIDADIRWYHQYEGDHFNELIGDGFARLAGGYTDVHYNDGQTWVRSCRLAYVGLIFNPNFPVDLEI